MASGQPRQDARKEPDEWEEAYHLSRVARSQRPNAGFIPNAEIAAQVAEAVASGLYGKEEAIRERPYRAHLRGNIWTVLGTLNPPGAYGGVAIIQLSKSDGRVLFAMHTQ